MSLATAIPTSPGNDVTSLFLSVTNKCNLTCSYCSADAGPSGRNRLEVEVAERQVIDWLNGARGDELLLVFSGGEPTLWGYPALDRICGVARETAVRRGKTLRIGMQTNGTTVSSRMIAFCLRWRVEPSVSLDGLPEISDSCRGRADDALNGLRRLTAAGISCAVICCLTREVAERIDEILEFFRAEGLRKVRINILGEAPGERAADCLSADELLAAKVAILNHMTRCGDDAVIEKNVADQVAAFEATMAGHSFPAQHCHALQCGAGRQIAAVNPDGAISMCIEKSMTDGLPTAPDLERLAARAGAFWATFDGWADCTQCSAQPICDHGCPVYHGLDHHRFMSECKATKRFWNHLVKARMIAMAENAGATIG